MTIEDLLAKLAEMITSVQLWFVSGFQKLISFDLLQLTIGQALFTAFAAWFGSVLIYILWHLVLNRLRELCVPDSWKKLTMEDAVFVVCLVMVVSVILPFSRN